MKYLSLVAILFMVLNTVPVLSVSATPIDEEVQNEDVDQKESNKSNPSDKSESDEQSKGQDCKNEGDVEKSDQKESDTSSVEQEVIDSDEKDQSTECESEIGESSDHETSQESAVEEEQDDSGLEKNKKESSEENIKEFESEENSTSETASDDDGAEVNNDDLTDDTSSSLSHYKESKTSKLGQFKNVNVKIYTDETLSDSFVAGEKHTNKVFYIKKQAHIDEELYYLLSTSPSSTKDTIGWVHSKDLDTHSHKSIDKTSKKFYFTGKGKAYSKAWGGSKDLVEGNLNKLKSQAFEVNLTENVGNNTWYRGTINGKTAWVHSSYLTKDKQSSTSKLGHLRAVAKIYNELGKENTTLQTNKYTNAVYYIKQQAEINDDTFYLISTSPSSTKDTLGWVHSKDLDTYDHKSIDKTAKKFYFTGKGKAYSKAWGGSKDLVEGNLNKLKSQAFEVNLTETVGNNTWYRGTINGKTAWVHSNYLTTDKQSSTSKLGHLRAVAEIYEELGKENTKLQTSKYTHAVYYIKQQAKINDDTFYLISTSPSSTKDTLGWVHSKDLDSRTHKSIDKTPKVFHFTGKGKSYSKAWGGSKDLVYGNMNKFKGKTFSVNLTEKVGGNVWYRGKVDGKNIWVHNSYVSENVSANYNLTLEEAVNIQMKSSPQTDLKYAYVSKSYIKNNKVNTSALNVRTGPSTSNTKVLGTLKENTVVKIISEPQSGWYQIEYDSSAWVDAARKDVKFHMDPKNFLEDERLRFQFLDLSKTTNASANKLNEVLAKKGILKGQGQAFINAGKKHGINDLYLISHAFLETGHGKSELANGIEVGKNSSGKPTLVTKQNRNQLKAIKKVYNMYGIGAYDNCAVECGATHAYEKGWTTPELAIVGGAEFIGTSYIKKGQNTLYKMRWNPSAMSNNGYAHHQYATDIGWASKQVSTMYNLYNQFGIDSPSLEIPVYK